MRKGTGIGIGVAVVVVVVIAVASMGNSPLAQIANTVQNGTSTDTETTSMINQTEVTGITDITLETLRVPLVSESYTIPPNGSKEITFTTAISEDVFVVGNATMAGDAIARIELRPVEGSCPIMGCDSQAIHGAKHPASFVDLIQINLIGFSGAEQKLILTSTSDQTETVVLNLDVVYEEMTEN